MRKHIHLQNFDLLKIAVFGLILMTIGCSDNSNNINKPLINKTPLFTVSEFNTGDKAFKHNQPLTSKFEIHETLGSGVGVIDIDNDGLYEVFFAQFNKNHTSSVLYKQENNKYSDITEKAGLDNLNSIMGVAVGDINNDGWSDLLVYGLNELHLMINHKGHFTETVLPIMNKDNFYTSATFFNANNDAYQDIWVSSYVKLDPSKICKGNDGLSMYCAPSAYAFQKDVLFISNEGRSFKQAPKSMIDIPASPSLGVVAADFNNDTLLDIFVANDGQNNFLFTQQTDGNYIEHAEIKSLGSNLAGLKEASMGIGIGDYDNNGMLDLFLTHLEQETNTLYKNEVDWFVDVTNQAGLGAMSRNQTGFGTGMYDFNGDNWLDLFVVNGRIQPKAYQQRTNLTEQFKESPMLYLNQEGRFNHVEIFNDVSMVGRGMAVIDLDNDGDKDIISSNNNQTPKLFANNLNPKNWYGLDLRCNNRKDVGAKIIYTIKQSAQQSTKQQTFYKNIHTDGSYASANDPRAILYLDESESFESVQINFSNQSTQNVSQKLINNQYETFICLSE